MAERNIRRLVLAAGSLALLASACAAENSSDNAGAALSSIPVSISPPSTPVPTASVSPDSSTSSPLTDPVTPWPSDPSALDGVAHWTIEVLSSTIHDPSAYLQGLELADDVLYESAGLYGESSIRIVDPGSGAVITSVDLDDQFFGEGLTVVGDELLQLTWRERTVFRRDRFSLEAVGEWSYEGEGWGLCLSGDKLVMSDGSDQLTLRDPDDFSVIDTLAVTIEGSPINLINELECIDGLVVANIYTTTDLIVVDPSTGEILATVDASSLLDLVAGRIGNDSGNVLNGIADLGDGTLLLGGKRWPEMFIVRLVSG